MGVLMTPRLKPADRRHLIGGSDARIIMGGDEGALTRLWREKRGEVEPQDLSGNLIALIASHDDPGVRAADKVAALGISGKIWRIGSHLRASGWNYGTLG